MGLNNGKIGSYLSSYKEIRTINNARITVNITTELAGVMLGNHTEIFKQTTFKPADFPK